MEAMRLLRNIVAYQFAFLMILLLYLPVLIVSGLCRYDKFLYVLSRGVFEIVLKIIGVNVCVHGPAGIDFSKPLVMVCNHMSNLDGPLLFSVLPCQPRALIKSEARRIPLIGWALKLADFVFVDRENPSHRQEALNEVVEKIKKNNYSFLVFPEGTRSKDGLMQNFKKGGFTIALRAGVPVLPIKISGSHQLLPPGRMAVQAGAVDIEWFSPLDLTGLQEDDVAEWTQKFQQKFYQDKKNENH